MRRRFAAALAIGCVGAVGAIAGCGGDDDGDAPEAATTVEVLDPGSEPRRAMELAVSEGDESTVRMETEISLGGYVEGSTEPPLEGPRVTMEVGTRVDDVRAEEVDYSFELVEVGVTRHGDDPAFATALEEALTPIEGSLGTATATSGGALVDSQIELPEEVDPPAASYLGQLDRQLGQLAVPFPPEPVGVGARWRATMGDDFSGIDAEYRTTYTLEELASDSYEVALELEVAMLPGPIDDPELQDADAELLEGSLDGSGRSEGSMARLAPDRSSGDLSGRLTLELTFEAFEGATERIEEETGMSFTLTSEI